MSARTTPPVSGAPVAWAADPLAPDALAPVPLARVAVGLLALSIVALAVSACASDPGGPPEIVVDESACSHCGMLISEPRFAAAYRDEAGTRLFDDIACMLTAIGAGDRTAIGNVWVHDVDTGDWIDAAEATFVRAPRLATPMAGGIVALRDHAAARELAARHGGQVLQGLDEALRAGPEGGRHGR